MLEFLFAIGFLIEFAIYFLPTFWHMRKYLAGASIVMIGFAAGALLAAELSVLSVLIAVISFYRVFNMLRVLEGRMHEKYLRRATLRTSLSLISCFAAAASVWLIWSKWGLSIGSVITTMTFAQLLVSVCILLITIRTITLSKHAPHAKKFADRDLPSVTVAIPARNESEDLIACLQSVVASDYPKLEVLVLDDCSRDKTSEIIRSFAQDGVRFIPGTEPRQNWLAKNQAYAALASSATGEYLIFCGVDVRIDSQTIKELISVALNTKKRMLSVLPKRYDSGIGISMIQPLRYWWEIAMPRRLFNRPPVLSTCWLINKSAIGHAGGFDAVSRTILPEAYFAREMIKQNAYGFIRADELMQVRTVKKFDEQLNTAMRMRYPQLRRRPENILLLTTAALVFMLAPFLILLSIYWVPASVVHAVALVSCLLLIATHSLIITVTNPANWWLALINFPFVVLLDVIISHISMWKYEFSVVEWKGRNICIPVMHTIPKLPSLDTRK